jgi:arylsulfatase A-like enzyme
MFFVRRVCLGLFLSGVTALAAAAAPAKNAVIFVSDGLRAVSVTPETAPTMAALAARGVRFANSHSLFPTVTTANASAIATGHYLGDTGDFANTLWFDFPLQAHGGMPETFLETDSIQAELNAHYHGNYLNEISLIGAAHRAGFATAVVGKIGASAIQDVSVFTDKNVIVIDDQFGHPRGIPAPPNVVDDIEAKGLAAQAPATSLPNVDQQVYLVNVATHVVLPRLVHSGKPFVFVFWSRDPDYTQHNAKDSVGNVTPGINGPTDLAAVRNADTTLATLLAALKDLGVADSTDVFLTADHGFATVAHTSITSPAAHLNNPVGTSADLPGGFLAIDIASELKLPLYDLDAKMKPVDFAKGDGIPSGEGLIGSDPAHAEVAITANGGSDLIYLPQADAKARAQQIVAFLMKQDYVSGVFVNDALGKIPGTLPMSAINLIGSAVTPRPAIIVNFRSFSTGCAEVLLCTASVMDTPLKTGQGNHGGFSRAETRNFMAAAGPDFKTGFVDEAPVSNADIAHTLAKVLGLPLPTKGRLGGRVIGESLKGGAAVSAIPHNVVSAPGEGGLRTVLNGQQVGATLYFDAAGFAGRTVGLTVPGANPPSKPIP